MKKTGTGIKQTILLVFLIGLTISLFAQTKSETKNPIPVVWTTYKKVVSTETDFTDLKAHGVELINMSARDATEAREKLELGRKWGMKFHIGLPEITESAGSVREAGLVPVDALMIGGVYRGKAIDRHLFQFKAGRNKIVIEPPVYHKNFAYTANSSSIGKAGKGEPIGHYYPDMPAPLRAEIIVPLKKFDGKQHLKIIKAEITVAQAGTKPEADSVTPEMPASSEISQRKLYEITFDLTGLEKALLDHVGVAVYWPYHGTNKYWIFSRGNVSATAESTKQALQKGVQKELNKWKEANNGTFPLDVVAAARIGDECFYISGHSHSTGATAVSYPLWEYSEPMIQAFHQHAGEIEYPRTWGFPEIYGEQSYSWWMYNLHEKTAGLIGLAHDEIAKTAPGLKLFRNTTRMGIFDFSNNFDGTGQELLTRNLDIVHLDPYPVGAGYSEAIPRDMSYCAGLARRYNRLLIPWMQAHVYGQLQHVTPDQVDRMAQEQWDQGVDGIVWLGYGDTFPLVRPDSWERAAAFHRKLANGMPPKPVAKLAVLRSYNAMALSSLWEKDKLRNPADWLLQQFLEVWAVQQKKPYDVFELPPHSTVAELKILKKELKKYPHIVSTIPWKGALEIGSKTNGTIVETSGAKDFQREFEKQISSRGW